MSVARSGLTTHNFGMCLKRYIDTVIEHLKLIYTYIICNNYVFGCIGAEWRAVFFYNTKCFVWGDCRPICPHMRAMILRICNCLDFGLLSAKL